MKDIGSRMKGNYELRARHYLTRRTPVIVRVDGRAFHTLTAKYDKPFDKCFVAAMIQAAKSLFHNMQGCKMAYIQSDEASFVLTDYDNLSTEGWFNYRQSKIESISASQMSVAFCSAMYDMAFGVMEAAFDSRSFSIPEDEVANYFLWRAQDWHRNSVTMYAQAYFSHKQLFRANIPAMHEMLHGIGKNWTTDLHARLRNGTFLYRSGGEIFSDQTVLPKFSDINAIWEKVRPREETEFKQERMNEPW